ncbi:hypothetical protein [Lactiplantibacillus plantarum]|uniref:hypothetical protein n=1 Tax=Lactiplantibacillus plantarum TaxID=1590 RepID=UPI001BAE2B3A|nr:hypothetical protein [Lactiplantibacillus plantarum]MBS0935677.1 hypothetical protein [Lactiplantibacillus plantarum]MBS0943966.1 hypothetical protein [Lactiplantibacillus plantarum]
MAKTEDLPMDKIGEWHLNKLCEYVVMGYYDEAYELVKNDSEKEFMDKFAQLYQHIDDREVVLSMYNFMLHSIFQEELAWKHFMIADFLIYNPSALVINDGVYVIALDHMRQALKLDNNNIIYLEGVLSFEGVPGVELSDEEAEKIRSKIKRIKSNG